jgi:iron complex outermembrane receptor protein
MLRISRLIGATLPLTLAALLSSPIALAQTTPAGTTDTAADDAGQDGEIVVTGSYARSIAAATEAKRKAAYGLDSIASTDIGKFPAQNVAEALQVVPGVAITRPRGEGLYVSVRGLGPQFQNTLVNGRTVALNDLIENGGANGRQFRFEMLPAEFVSSIDVVKTPTPDMNEGALGGNIDVKTFHPLDIGTRTTLNSRYTFTAQTHRVEPNATLLTSYRSPDETFGILAGAQYWGKQVRNDRFINFGWNTNLLGSASGLYTPTRTRPTVETEDRKRLSGIVSAQWQPTPALRTTLDVIATRLDVAYDEFGIDIYPDDPGTSVVAGSQKVVGNTVVGATINNARFMASREYSLNRHDLLTLALRQSFDQGRWHASADGSWSTAHSYHPSNAEGTVRSRAQFIAPLTYDASGGYTVLPTLTTTRNLSDPANYAVTTFNIAPKNSKDWDAYARADLGYDVGDGLLRRLAAGGEYHWRKRDYRRRDYLIDTVKGQPLSVLGSGAYQQLPYDDFLAGVSGNGPRTWLVPVTKAYYDALFTPAIANAALLPADRRSSFVTSEKIAAAYIRADYGVMLGSVEVTGNIGARYVHTDQVASGTLTTGGNPQAVSYPKSFDDVLPSFNLRAELTPQLVARLAASRVLTRPNITDTAPRITVSTDAATASGGNPQLNPFLATQFDGSLEWYFNRRGALTGAVFYKNLDDYITAQNVNIDIPSRGTVLLSTSVNGGKAKVYGVEAAYNQVFTFLPKPLDGLGIQASYTHTSVEANYTAGNRVLRNEMLGLSKQSYNLVGFYDYGPVSARLSYVWRDKYLSGTGSTTQAPTFTAPFGSLDGNLSLRVTPQLMFSVEGINLAGARAYTYNDDTLRFGEINYYGRTILFGARAEF